MTDLQPRRKKVGTASKILVTGAIAGGGLALVGAMTVSAQTTTPAPAPTVIVRQVVVPSTDSAPNTTLQTAPAPLPTPAPAPAATSQAEPVTESGGS